MRNAKLWFFNTRVVPDNAFRLYSYFRWVVDRHPHPKGPDIVVINREHLKRLLGLSYNSIQRGLKKLIELGLIELDPEKEKSKDCIRLTSEDEYNKPLLTQLFLSLLSNAKQEAESQTSDLDVEE